MMSDERCDVCRSKDDGQPGMPGECTCAVLPGVVTHHAGELTDVQREVQELKEDKKKLEEKEKKLEKKKKKLEEELDLCITRKLQDNKQDPADVYLRLTFSDVVTNDLKQKLARVEEGLSTVRKDLAEVRKQQTIVMQRQGTKEPNGFKFTAKVLNGLNAKNLRKNITTSAADCLAFGGHNHYLAAPSFVPGSSLALEIELYFPLREEARKFHASLRNCVAMYRSDILRVTDVVITPGTHSFDPEHQITCDTYKPGDSPRRGEDTDIILPSNSSATTTVLTEEVVEQESLVERNSYDPARRPEWCHIKEKPDCSGGEARDEANRLVMHAGLHQLYDGYVTHDDRCPPGMSVYCHHNDRPTGDYEDGEYQPVTVRVIFSSESVAKFDQIYLRNCHELHDRVFQCTFYKKYPSRFVSYLNTRHASNVERNTNLRDPTADLVLPQGTSDDVGNLSDLSDVDDN